MNRDKLLDILLKIPIFQGLSANYLQIVASMPKVYEKFEAGKKIVVEGETSQYFYILLSGSVSVCYKETEVAHLDPPQFIGEMGFICQEPRIATVVAEADALTMKLDRENFNNLPIHIREAIKDKIISGLVSRLAQVNQRIVELEGEPVTLEVLDDTFVEEDLL